MNFLRKISSPLSTGSGALFLIQMVSILGFSVLYSSLILYATQELHMSDLQATSLTGAFLALNYFLHLLSGLIGGRYLSYRCLFMIGMALQIIACPILAIASVNCLLTGLAFFLAGCGLNITCINCMLTQLFEPEDTRRESAFLWNYSGQNIGFFVGFMLAGYFELNHGYRQLFLLSSIGNIIAILLVLLNWNMLADKNSLYSKINAGERNSARSKGVALIAILVACLAVLLRHTSVCNAMIVGVTIVMFSYLFLLSLRQDKDARHKMWAYFTFAAATMIFWTLVLLGPMALNLFTERNVDRHLLGMLIAPQWIQNANTMTTIIGGPLLGMLFAHLRKRGINISISLQFSTALALIGAAFLILPIGIKLANSQGYSSINWVLASNILQSLADLFISPIGYAMVGQLAPRYLSGLMMGTWLMFGGVTGVLADYLSESVLTHDSVINPLLTNINFSGMFNEVGYGAMLAGLFMVILIPLLNKVTATR